MGNLEEEVGAAVSSLSDAGNEVAKLANYFNRLFEANDEQVQRIVNKTETTLDALSRVLNNVDDIIGSEKVREDMKKSLAEFPQLLADTRNDDELHAIDRRECRSQHAKPRRADRAVGRTWRAKSSSISTRPSRGSTRC